MQIRNAQNIAESDFFPTENAGSMPEIAVFEDFYWTFSLYLVVFSHKNNYYNNAQPSSMVQLSIKLIFVAGTL